MKDAAAPRFSQPAPDPAPVLIVDDDPEQTGQIVSFLARNGIAAAQENNGFAALNTMKKLEPAVVVMDVRMPGLDGIAAARLAKRTPSRPHIILMSGDATQVRRAIADEVEVFAVVDKPLPLRVLTRFIRNALDGRGPGTED